jgi:hypothetical protein
MFLATPHRGLNHAGFLAMVLAVAFSQKVFVGQLEHDSVLMEMINDQFRDRASSLELVSFRESTGIRGVGV